MAEHRGQEHERDEHQRARHIEQNTQEPQAVWDQQETPSYPTSLLNDTKVVNSRGNKPVQTALMVQMQQTYGNRATRRYLQRQATASSSQTAVQRHPVEQQEQEEELQKPVAIQKMSAGETKTPVQREDPPGTTATAEKKPEKLEPTDPKRIDIIKENIKGTTHGAHAIEVLATNKVTMVMGPAGQGSFFDSGANKITFNSGKSDVDLGFTFVHEANHAEYHHGKKTANTSAAITKLSKDDYVNKMLDEETASTALQIETKIDLEAKPGTLDITKASTQPGEVSYKKGFKAAYDKAIADKKDEATAKAEGKKAGMVLLRKDFEEGITIVVSIPPNPSYKKYYGDAWDKANTKKAD